MIMCNSAFRLFVLRLEYKLKVCWVPFCLVCSIQDDPGKLFNQHVSTAYIGEVNSEDVANVLTQ